jgi:hypothetical protein
MREVFKDEFYVIRSLDNSIFAGDLPVQGCAIIGGANVWYAIIACNGR